MHFIIRYFCLFVRWTYPNQLLQSIPIILKHSIRQPEVAEHFLLVVADADFRVTEDNVIRIILHDLLLAILHHREHLHAPITKREDKPLLIVVLPRHKHPLSESTDEISQSSANEQKQVLLVIDVLVETCIVSLIEIVERTSLLHNLP